MAVIEFKKLYAKNFLSYEELDFSFKKGIFGIVGINKDVKKENKSNGAGKTGIPDALLFLLTGTTFKGLRANDVIKEGKDSCFLKLIFTVNGKKGFIISKRNPNEIKFYNGTSFVEANSLLELQKKIMDFFGIDYDLLTRFILVGEKERHKFSFLGSDDRTIKDLLTKITNSEIIDRAYKSVVEDEKKYSNLLLVKKSEFDLKKNLLQDYLRDLKQAKKEIKQVNNENESNLEIFKKSLFEQKELLDELEKEITLRQKEIEKIEEKYEKKIDLLEQELGKIQIRKQFVQKSLRSIKKITCPHCKKEFLLDSEFNVAKHIKEFEKEYKELEDNGEKLRNKIVSYENKKVSVLRSRKKKLDELINKFDEVENEVVKLKNEIIKIENKNKVERNMYVSKIKELKNKVAEQKNVLGKLKKEIKSNENKLNIVTKFKFYFGKEGLKNYLFSKKLRIIEYTVNTVLQEVGYNMIVKLSGMKKLKSGKWNQKITGKIVIDGNERDYSNLSKGEARIVDLAFIEALSRLLNVKNNIRLKMFDEPFSGLDEQGKIDVIEMLKNIKDSSVYVISPESDLIYKTFDEDSIFTVIKENGSSKIQKGYYL